MNARVEFAQRIEDVLNDTITVNINLLHKDKGQSIYGKNTPHSKNKPD